MLSSRMIEQYHKEGFTILENALSQDDIASLRTDCGRSIDRIHAEMDRLGTDVLKPNYRDRRYFITKSVMDKSSPSYKFVFGDTMAEYARELLGDNVYLFYEQYVVKGAQKGMKFDWHQDSGYVGFEHKTYLTCWCALDNISEANGTAYILPFSRVDTRDMVEHSADSETGDMVGYQGSDPGDPVLGPAGTIAFFTSRTLHRSGENHTDSMRRVYVVQYSPEPITHPDHPSDDNLAIPFIIDGKKVR